MIVVINHVFSPLLALLDSNEFSLDRVGAGLHGVCCIVSDCERIVTIGGVLLTLRTKPVLHHIHVRSGQLLGLWLCGTILHSHANFSLLYITHEVADMDLVGRGFYSIVLSPASMIVSTSFAFT